MYILRGHRLVYTCMSVPEDCFILANQAEPDEVLHCFQNLCLLV